MNICIVYELNNREFYNAVLLERELIRRGHKVRVMHKTESMNLLKSYDVTIIPNSYRTSDVDFYKYIFNTKNNLVIVYPCEQISTNHIPPQFFDYDEKNAVKQLPHLCWGRDYYDWITSLGFKNTNTQIVGAIQLDLCRPQFRGIYKNKSQLQKEFNIPMNKKWILFISDFVLINEERLNQFVNAGAGDRKTYEIRRKFEDKTSKELLSWFEMFLKDNSDYIIIYRKHPVEILTEEIDTIRKNRKDQFFLISDLSIKEWIFNCDYVTTWNSTAVVECFAGNVKLGLLRPFDFTEESNMKEYSFYENFHSIKTYAEFCECIKNGFYQYTKESVEEINKLYSIESTPAFIRAANAIENIYRQENKNDSFKPMEYKKNRDIFLLKNHIIVKLLLKNIFKLFYRITNLKLRWFEKKKMGFNEWMLSVDNNKQKKKINKSIDYIINKFN